jgi:catechol 2,3-dioxygenase-like lactoylglutathione lyase family enzyme
MPKYKYHHAHIMSPDPLKTAEFYEKIFGAKREQVIKNPDGDVMVHLNLDGSRIWVSGSKSNPPFYGLHHIALSTDNIEEAVAELKANEVKFIRDISEPKPGVQAAVFWAPENVRIEFWVDSKES